MNEIIISNEGGIMQETKNKKILIVDDERELLKVTKEYLQAEGFLNIYTAENCFDALQIVKNHPIALCILDIMLPDGDGFSLLEQIRQHSQAPIIFLTARGEAEDKIRGFGLGAEDYIVKPFLMKELSLRISALLKRVYSIVQEDTAVIIGKRTIDFETATVRWDENEVQLTAKEFLLLKKLCENQNRIVTSDSLCMTAWGDEYYGYENTLMVHIRRLREKIEDNPSSPQHLITVKGLGYKLVTNHE